MTNLHPDPAREPAQIELPAERRFPFSPWHPVLLPIALVMLIPMIWMVVTSFETISEARRFPPVLVPSSIQWQNYLDVLQDAPFIRWFINSTKASVLPATFSASATAESLADWTISA